MKNGVYWDGSDVTGTLTARNAGGGNGCQIKRISMRLFKKNRKRSMCFAV